MLVGIIIGIILFRVITRPKNQIIYCRERDGRAMELDISKEDHITLETKTDPPLRFYKYGRSYELRKRGRAFTRFLGKEGTAYTWIMQGFKKVGSKLQEIKVPFPTLEDAVKSVWGEFYTTVPENMQKALQNNSMLVTVNLEPGITPEGYKPITEATIRKKNREDAKDLIARGLKGAIQKDWFERLAWIGTGAGLTMVGMLLLGVIG